MASSLLLSPQPLTGSFGIRQIMQIKEELPELLPLSAQIDTLCVHVGDLTGTINPDRKKILKEALKAQSLIDQIQETFNQFKAELEA